MFETLAALVGLAAVGWFWVESLRVRETAQRACRTLCRSHNLQFLDDTVALSYLGLVRSTHRLLGIRRVYRFEFSRGGNDRDWGSVTMHGSSVETIYLPNPEVPLQS